MASSIYTFMPKYDKPLNGRELDLFFNHFKLWAGQQRLTENAMKATLALAFTADVAKEWCLLNYNITQDGGVSFDNFVKLFMEQVPMKKSSPLEVMTMLSTPPDPQNPVSGHLIRLRYRVGKDWPATADQEEGIIAQVVNSFPKELATYIACKDQPKNYTELLQLVREYEDQGIDTKAAPTQPFIKAEINKISEDPSFLEMKAMLNILIHEVAAQKMTSDKPKQPSDKSLRKVGDKNEDYYYDSRPICYICNRRGHIQRDCYYRNPYQHHGFPQFQSGAFFKNQQDYGPQQQWHPPFHNTPYVTYPASVAPSNQEN